MSSLLKDSLQCLREEFEGFKGHVVKQFKAVEQAVVKKADEKGLKDTH